MIVYRELSSLCADLALSPKELYGLSNSIPRHYRTVKIPKKNGGIRILQVPDAQLLRVQRRINEILLSGMPVSPYACAYVRGRGILKNAASHAGAETLLKLDVLHFFDSILYRDVKAYAFPPGIYSEPLRVLLASLCFGQDGLPQGAATSPSVSNLVLLDFDNEVGAFCQARDIRYTRYCDDLSFSGNFDPSEVVRFVSEALRRRGFFLNRKKTVFAGKGQKKTVTGLVVNERVNIPQKTLSKIRQEMYYIEKFGIRGHLMRTGNSEDPKRYLMRLLGKVNYALSVRKEDDTLKTYREKLMDLMKHSEKPDEAFAVREETEAMETVSVAEMRARDAMTIESGISSRELMGRAARGIYEAYDGWKDGTVIFTGSGNNGGDGFALAVILAQEGISCTVLSVSDKRTADSAWYEEIAQALGVKTLAFDPDSAQLRNAPVIVDCLLGTGFSGEPRPAYASAIRAVNRAKESGSFVISADINSGMNGDTGEGDPVVESDLTVTIGLMKQGLRTAEAKKHIGEIRIALIGIL